MFLSPFALHTHAPHPSQQYRDYQSSPAVMLLIDVVSLSLPYFFVPLFHSFFLSLSHHAIPRRRLCHGEFVEPELKHGGSLPPQEARIQRVILWDGGARQAP